MTLLPPGSLHCPVPSVLKRIGGKQPSHRENPPKFGNMGGSVQTFGRRLMDHFDFQGLGVSHVNQVQLVYLTCVSWRLLAANERRKQSPTKSWNEIRESVMRDSLGMTFWFFATPILQRLFLQGVSRKNPALGQALVQENPDVRKAPGVMGTLKRLSPLTRLNIPTSEQVKDQMEQALHALKAKGVGKTDTAYLKTERFYKDLLKYRNFATALGLGTTIALLGVGINALNFYLTRKNMERRRMEMQSSQDVPAFKPPEVPSFVSSPAGSAKRPPLNPFAHRGLPPPPALYPNQTPLPPVFIPSPLIYAAPPRVPPSENSTLVAHPPQ